MIPINEIRHGNYCTIDLQGAGGETICQIRMNRTVDLVPQYTSIESFAVSGEHAGKEVLCFDAESEHVQPIPLTPELLEKCGFEKGERGRWHFPDPHFESIVDMSPIFYLHGTPMKAFQYLHQLQNLYFALTGEELEVNL